MPNRTALILEREQAAFAGSIVELSGEDGEEPEPTGETPTVSVAEIAAGLSGERPKAVAAFLAGRCDTEAPGGRERLAELLDGVLGSLDPQALRSQAAVYVEAAMSVALRGDLDKGHDALAPLVSDDGPESMADWLAAYYLAQMGDPQGWPKLVRMLEDEADSFTRLMAARHLVGFLPYVGQTIGGVEVDVVGRLAARLDDSDSLVAYEIPGLLAEAAGTDARPILEKAANDASHEDTRMAAKRTLESLDAD